MGGLFYLQTEKSLIWETKSWNIQKVWSLYKKETVALEHFWKCLKVTLLS